MKKKTNEKEKEPPIQRIMFSIDTVKAPRIIKVSSETPGYRTITFELPKFMKDWELQEKFFWIVIGRPKEIASKTNPIKLSVEKEICKTFGKYISYAIHTPHDGKKLWEKEQKRIISRLDPIRHFSIIWNILDKIYQDIE